MTDFSEFIEDMELRDLELKGVNIHGEKGIDKILQLD